MRSAMAFVGLALLGGLAATVASIAQDAPAQVNVLGGIPERPIPGQPTPVPPSAVVSYRQGEDLLSRLPPGEREVTVFFNRVPGLLVTPPDGIEFEEYLTREADVVAVVRPTAIQGELTRDRDWIRSVVDAELVRVLKVSAESRVSEADTTVSFRASGGSLLLQGVQVTAITSDVEEIQAGVSYLVFLVATSEGLFSMGPRTVYELRGDRLHCIDVGEVQVPFNNAEHSVVSEKIYRARFLPRINAPRGAR